MASRSVWAIVLIIFAIVPAAAEGGMGFGPQIGIYKAQGADEVRIMPGVALRVKLSDVIGVEGSINYRKEEFGGGFVNVTSWPVMITGLLYPIPVVYGALGAGWYNTTIDYNSGFLGGPVGRTSETKQAFGWHFGGGVELPLGEVAKLVGDIRYVFLNYDFNSFPGSNGVDSNFYVITAGLLFGL